MSVDIRSCHPDGCLRGPRIGSEGFTLSDGYAGLWGGTKRSTEVVIGGSPGIAASGSLTVSAKVYSSCMTFTLWLSADEERILDGIMRHEGTRTKELAVIAAIRAKGALLDAEQRAQEVPASVASSFPGQPNHRS